MIGQTLLELYECSPNKLDDVEGIHESLLRLPKMFGLTPLSPPTLAYTFQGRSGTATEHDGIVGHIIIAESHINVHTRIPELYATVDFFSCKDYDERRVITYWKDFFEAKSLRKQTFEAQPPTRRIAVYGPEIIR